VGAGVTSPATPPVTAPTTVAPPLRVGPLEVWPPVVLAPMAGITNAPFRRLCRAFGAAAVAEADGESAGATRGGVPSPARGGLFVSEMITARGLAERNDKTLRMARFADDEPVRSIQLYGTDPRAMDQAVRLLVGEGRADHVDLNFGCPVAKVTRKGGGAALPVHRALFRDIVRAAVRAAGEVPVTVKLRIGVDDGRPTFVDAGRIARDEGAAAVALHARTAAQHYSGRADWGAVSALREVVTDVPVLGNGDIWLAGDALRMVAETGCDGVVVGRGCLGRPWLFGDLARAFAGRPAKAAPTLAEVTAVLRRHAHLLAEWLTEPVAVRDVRKHVGWYLQGYPVGGEVRRRLTATTSLAALDAELDRLAAEHPALTLLPGADARPRGKTSGPIAVTLPEGWLASADDPSPVVADDLDAVSGG
jgi:nifR3 family TIM-barrel protein